MDNLKIGILLLNLESAMIAVRQVIDETERTGLSWKQKSVLYKHLYNAHYELAEIDLLIEGLTE